eukprot:2057632-Pyramimonas_sp.AAC.1
MLGHLLCHLVCNAISNPREEELTFFCGLLRRHVRLYLQDSGRLGSQQALNSTPNVPMTFGEYVELEFGDVFLRHTRSPRLRSEHGPAVPPPGTSETR